MPRGIDHIVLPVATLDVARARYEALGFTVNKDGIHPFGTANCCVFFENGTYFEPLAIHDPAKTAQMTKTNAFVNLDRTYRDAMGDEGLSAIALQSVDASADQEKFEKAGRAGISMLSFSRKAVHDDGTEDILSVDGAFCLHGSNPTFNFFTTSWLGDADTIAKIKRAPAHTNGVLGVVAVTLEAEVPEIYRDYLTLALGEQPTLSEEGLSIDLPNATLRVGKAPGEALRAQSITLLTDNLSRLANYLTDNDVDYRAVDATIHVPRAAGQGVDLVFVERV